MTRRCETCQTDRPEDEFDARGLCRRCSVEVRGPLRTVRVPLPPGWTAREPALPEMTLPSAEELADGYEGVLWEARGAPWVLEVRWRGDRRKFLCRALREDEETPRSDRALDYPHEVVEWLQVWLTQIAHSR